MKLISTRNSGERIEASRATLQGIAPDGGLYVPVSFPDIGALGDIVGMHYAALCAKVLGLFFDDIKDLEALTQSAYRQFDDESVAPVKKIGAGEYVLELWHGPTLAFKDMALSVLPRLMTASMDKGRDILILVATSGDTGKAALEGFCDVERTKILVFYPDDGVSDMQRLQMVTQEGGNTHVVAVKGNFDDAQNGVKAIFTDSGFIKTINDKGYGLSSANSINFGRLAPQIAYYIWAYARLLTYGDISLGEKINFVVPTGNFGNILAAYYAKKMGLPVNKLICASNKNNVLADFFKKGEYSLKRAFYKTMSPSMDILISSNLERLLFELTDRDAAAVTDMMRRLKESGAYAIDGQAKKTLESDFYAGWCDESETMDSIKSTFEEKGYLLDTHTAVAAGVYGKYKKTGDTAKTVIVSTASPYKFPEDVLLSLGEDVSGMSIFDMAQKLSGITGTAVPAQIKALESMPVLHTRVVETGAMRDAVLRIL
ncbi:MAG: threonine synthase [Eubacteriales bacterium]|nr:threonine synthase [Eubacteriales bacterium]